MTFDSLNLGDGPPHLLSRLAREDQDLIMELVLCSGSLKDLADVYGVSYPTIRLRLDKVIERVRSLKAGRKPDPLSDLLADMIERGELSGAAARRIRDAARKRADG
ncbi:MAG: DUF2089 family protein [Phycisphaeraceae bacterium]|nr:DUF2089 family protein [Phycisphaeraceae bacterium]